MKVILDDLIIKHDPPMGLFSENKSTISFALNLVQHDRIKHIDGPALHIGEII